MRKRKILRKQKVASIDNLPVINPNAAGLDIASDEIMACVPSDRDPHNIQAFGTFTVDLHALADWLTQCRIDTVAMESTGLYWIPIFELLEVRGFKVILVNPLHAKQVAGRKSDVSDAQWIQTLHTFGLLEASFRPDADIAILRTLRLPTHRVSRRSNPPHPGRALTDESATYSRPQRYHGCHWPRHHPRYSRR